MLSNCQRSCSGDELQLRDFLVGEALIKEVGWIGLSLEPNTTPLSAREVAIDHFLQYAIGVPLWAALHIKKIRVV